MKATIDIEAVQWFKDGDHPDVKLVGLNIYRRGGAAYISGLEIRDMFGFWLEFEKQDVKPDDAGKGLFSPDGIIYNNTDGSTYYRRLWPFNVFDFKGPKSETPVTEDDEFYKDYIAAYRLYKDDPEPLRPYGRLSDPHAMGGFHNVFPGYWVIKIADRYQVMDDTKFKRTYPNLEAA
jgi:hypothetical protein